jgi:hypothetical protein
LLGVIRGLAVVVAPRPFFRLLDWLMVRL